MKDLAEQIAKPRKIALYVHMEHGFYSLSEVTFLTYDEHYDSLPEGVLRESALGDGYTRVSEPLEIKLTPIGHDEIMANGVKSLEETERKLMVETEQKLTKIREQKRQLLALAHMSETEMTK